MSTRKPHQQTRVKMDKTFASTNPCGNPGIANVEKMQTKLVTKSEISATSHRGGFSYRVRRRDAMAQIRSTLLKTLPASGGAKG